MKFKKENFILDKIKKINLYKIECPICGWRNTKEIVAHYCPKCGENLWSGKLNEINGSIFPIILNTVGDDECSEEDK